jgi:protease IV
MPYDAEALADRRRLSRRVSFWRVLAVLGVVVALAAIGFRMGDKTGLVAGQSHIARISIDGFIDNDRKMIDLIKRAGETKSVSGVVVSVNSPGGTTTGAEGLYLALRDLSGKKPTVAFVNGMAASGGYIAAIGTDHIIARETSLVGSIGVLFQFPNVARLLDTVGVKMEEVKSSPLKAAPNGFEPTSPEARAALQRVVDDTYGWFKRLVAERRKLNDAGTQSVSDGRVHSGKQAMSLGLVDGLGGERDAVAWLEGTKGLAKDLPIKDWKPKSDVEAFDLWSLAAFSAEMMGFEGLAYSLRQAETIKSVKALDGLLVVWQPALEK